MTTNTNNKLTDETLKAWKTEAIISLGETPKDCRDYSHHEAILALVTELQERRKADNQEPASERERIRREHAEWSDATFGDVGPIGPLKHLSKEALDAAADPSDPLEWADMQFLLWDAQRRAGVTDEQITMAMVEKLAINKARQWPEPKDGEPRLHIKEQLIATAKEEIAPPSLTAKPVAFINGAGEPVLYGAYIGIAVGTHLYTTPPAPVVPEKLPCSVELKPGLIIGKGCKTETLLTALRRRAEYYAKLEAMTPEEREKHGASIEAFKAMLPQPAPVDKEFIPKNLDKALGVVGVALPESKEEFNFQIERWIQRLIDRVIRYADEFKEQPATVVPEEMNFSTACNFVQINGMAKEDRATLAMRAWNACRAALLQDGFLDLSQPVDPQIAKYEQIMLQAGWVMVPVEPTDEMIAAAMNCDDVVFDSTDPTAFCVQYREIYCAMVDATPKPELTSE